MGRESIVFYKSFYDAIKGLNYETQSKIYNAIFAYQFDGIESELDGVEKAVFTLIKPQLDANNTKYENGCKGKEYGKLGGRPKKETPKKPQENPKQTPNDNENENVNVNDNDNASDSCVDGLQKIINFYENNIGVITPYILEILQDFAEEMNYEIVIFAMQKAVEANIRTIQYIKGTLNNWTKKGIKTLLEAKEESKNFSKNKSNSAEEEFLNEHRWFYGRDTHYTG